jgi:hypothetical protein
MGTVYLSLSFFTEKIAVLNVVNQKSALHHKMLFYNLPQQHWKIFACFGDTYLIAKSLWLYIKLLLYLGI